jgi:DNA invertase Pin-like site-specific DNA recombinase
MRKVDARGRRTKGLRAVLLARVSTLKRSQDKSAPRQIAELRELAGRRGWEVVADFTDRQSGGDDDRPGLQAAIDLVEHHRAEVLVVHELDRLGRNVTDLLKNADRVSAAGGHLAIRDLDVDTTSPEGRLHFTMMAGLAEYQRRSNVGKVLSGLATARKKGIRLGRPPLAPAVIDRARALRARKMSWGEIAEQLRAEKLADGENLRNTIANAVKREAKRSGAGGPRPARKTRARRRRPDPRRSHQ